MKEKTYTVELTEYDIIDLYRAVAKANSEHTGYEQSFEVIERVVCQTILPN